ncbi:ankyrin repeat domain-containing protein, partial [Anaeroarcus burkinensis]|uniref:ankyrin repeat domain-containing protein n=1 Tax=Anaeroarcus burkinensis TaxID=82376 RepID=UPI00138AD930
EAPIAETAPEEAPAAPAADPNAQMSQDDITALLASMQSEPEKTEEPPVAEAAPEAAPAAPAADPNAQMNQDDVAALLASMQSEPEKAEEPPVAEAAPEEAPAAPAADPNAQMSQDDIAALLASMQSEPEKAEEPPVAEAAPEAAPAAPAADPNAQMSQDDIAALLASMQSEPEKAEETPVAEAAPEEAPAAPAADPNVQMSQDDIEKLLSDLGPLEQTEQETPTEATPKLDDTQPVPILSDAETATIEPVVEETPASTSALSGRFAAFLLLLKTWFAKLPLRKRAAALEAQEAIPAKSEASSTSATEEEDVSARKLSFKAIAATTLLLLPLVVLAGYYLGVKQHGSDDASTLAPKEALSQKGVAFSQQAFVENAERGNLTVAGLFLDAGMSPEVFRAFDGYTPLIAASESGRLATVELLLNHGANVNAIDKDKQTALMRAAAAGRLDVVRLLIDRGADLARKDKLGQTALRLAANRNQGAVVQWLRSLNAPDEGPAAGTPPAPPPELATSKPSNVPDSQIAPSFLLANGQAGPIKIGLGLAGIRSAYPEAKISPDEIYIADRRYQILNVYPDPRDTTPSLSITLSPSRSVLSIDVYSSAFRTNKNIGVGSTLGELRQSHTLKAIRYMDGSFLATASDTNVLFELGVSVESLPTEWLQGNPESTLPNSLKISRIIVQQ